MFNGKTAIADHGCTQLHVYWRSCFDGWWYYALDDWREFAGIILVKTLSLRSARRKNLILALSSKTGWSDYQSLGNQLLLLLCIAPGGLNLSAMICQQRLIVLCQALLDYKHPVAVLPFLYISCITRLTITIYSYIQRLGGYFSADVLRRRYSVDGPLVWVSHSLSRSCL